MKDKKILLYAGTTEGRKLASYLGRRGVKTARLCGNRLWGESASGREEYNGDTRPDGQWADGRVYEGV